MTEIESNERIVHRVLPSNVVQLRCGVHAHSSQVEVEGAVRYVGRFRVFHLNLINDPDPRSFSQRRGPCSSDSSASR